MAANMEAAIESRRAERLACAGAEVSLGLFSVSQADNVARPGSAQLAVARAVG